MPASPSTPAVHGLELSSDSSRLDPWFCAQAIREANYNPGITDDACATAVRNSVCIGAYMGQQVGLIRFVTDGALFSSLTELYVAELCRGRGIGTALLGAAFADPRIKPTHCILRARSHLWLFYYKNADFHVIDRRHGIMQRAPRW